MKSNVSLEQVQKENPHMTRQQILAKEGLGAFDLTIDTSCHKKTYGDKMQLKKMKKYHKQFGAKLNTAGAKNAFFSQAVKSLTKRSNVIITTT